MAASASTCCSRLFTGALRGDDVATDIKHFFRDYKEDMLAMTSALE